MDSNNKNENTAAAATSTPVREMARELYFHLILDCWPSLATTVDFGIKTQEHYGALQYAVQHHDVSPEHLDDAMGSGPALTALIRPDNPYYGVNFETPWDGIMENIKAWADVGPGAKFPLGRLFATKVVLLAISREEIKRALRRHAAGDWGNIPPDEAERNDWAVHESAEIQSTYLTEGGAFFDVVTEPDRSMTVVHLHSER